jgi:hypothetical protein
MTLAGTFAALVLLVICITPFVMLYKLATTVEQLQNIKMARLKTQCAFLNGTLKQWQAHLATCKRCRSNAFNLCDVGRQLTEFGETK